MGHYASEMDPHWGTSIERAKKVINIKNILATASLEYFNVGDLGALYRLMEKSSSSLTDKEIEYLEKKAVMISLDKKRNGV